MFGIKELRKEVSELKKSVIELRGLFRELKLQIIKLKYPPKYKVGESYPDTEIDNVKYRGGIIYEIELNEHRLEMYHWTYYILNGSEKLCRNGDEFFHR